MRALYLLRHGQPAFPQSRPCCLGRLNLSLSRTGQAQAVELARYFQVLPPFSVLSSPLDRCRQTACVISPVFSVLDGLAEVDMGLWDGLSFREIQVRWPQQYQKRGDDLLSTAPPRGESLLQCGQRAGAALRHALTHIPCGDLILVAHSGVNRMLLSQLLPLSAQEALSLPQPYGSVTQLLLEGDSAAPGPIGAFPQALPRPVPDQAVCLELLSQFGTPSPVIDHCRAVADRAMELWRILDSRGVPLHRELVLAGALLHDIARARPDHARAGAQWLTQRGYASLGAIVGDHMELPAGDEGQLSEKSLVFLADKLIQGTTPVTLEVRFSQALSSPEHAPYAQRRYRQASILWSRLFP